MPSARSRTSIRRSSSEAPRTPWRFIATILVTALVISAIAVGVAEWRRPPADATSIVGRDPLPLAASLVATEVTHSGTVEVPDVVGMARTEAEVLLSAAGLIPEMVSEESSSALSTAADLVVARQEPAAGSLVSASSAVVVTLMSRTAPVSDVGASLAKEQPSKRQPVVCIDPGHQAKGDSMPEPVGPGAKATKPRVTGGATGVGTGIPEYEIVLQISMNLKAQLEARGVKVVLTRTTNDVSLSNAERAAIANKAEADLFVRIHCDGSPDSKAAGLSTLYPASNKWTSGFSGASKRAARMVQSSTILRTGAIDRGLVARGDITGFNWAKVPALLVECGFLSNPVEDRLLASPHYQDKLALGIAEGVIAFLEETRR